VQRLDFSRRDILLTACAGVLAGQRFATAMDIDVLGEPLGVQALAIRRFIVADLDGTLELLRAMDYGQIELVSFPGFVGNFRGDFTPLEYLPPSEIRRRIVRAGLDCHSCHFLAHEYEHSNWNETLDWARGIGIDTMVYAGGELPRQPTVDDMRRHFDLLNETGARVRTEGMRMAIHSDADFWRSAGDRTVADYFVEHVEPSHCAIQLDFGSVVQAGVEGAQIVERYGDRIESIHLRDGKPPIDPEAYLPALPLGEGDVDWRAVMAAARRVGIHRYIVEMQLRPLVGMLDALRTSVDYLKALQV
jgi:sugar phosphate isomerase/epimerase